MHTRAFLDFQCRQYLFRLRWLLPVPLGLLLGYWGAQVLAFLSGQAAAGGSAPAVQGNALEAFIWAFGKPEIVYFVATVLFIYLVADLLPETVYGQWALIRLQSRRRWWALKVLTVLLSTLVYCVLLFASFFLPVAIRFPFSTAWSPAGLSNAGMSIGFSPLNGGPLQGAASIALLLFVGWFAVGLLVLTVNQLTRRPWAGFLAAALVVICGKMGSITGGAINQTGWVSYFLLWNHLEYTPLWAPVREMPFAVSLAFWLVWILACFAAGFISSKRQDFLSTHH